VAGWHDHHRAWEVRRRERLTERPGLVWQRAELEGRRALAEIVEARERHGPHPRRHGVEPKARGNPRPNDIGKDVIPQPLGDCSGIKQVASERVVGSLPTRGTCLAAHRATDDARVSVHAPGLRGESGGRRSVPKSTLHSGVYES